MQDLNQEILEELRKLNKNLQKLILRNNLLTNISLKEFGEKNKLTTRQQIELLNLRGIDYKEIAEIFGRSPGYIASELTFLKNKSKKSLEPKDEEVDKNESENWGVVGRNK